MAGEADLRAEPLIEAQKGSSTGESHQAVWSEATKTKVPYGIYPIVSAVRKHENGFSRSL
jgi:hypothetical protein